MFREELFKHDSSTYSSWHVALWFFRHIVGHLWWHVGSFDARVGYPHSQWLLMYCLNYALEFSLTVSTRLWLWPCHCSMVCRLFLRHTSCANAVREFKCWVASNGGHLWQQTQRSSLFGCVCVCVCVLVIVWVCVCVCVCMCVCECDWVSEMCPCMVLTSSRTDGVKSQEYLTHLWWTLQTHSLTLHAVILL